MGIAIGCDETAGIPRAVSVVLTCDLATEFFCRGSERFSSDDGFIGAHAAAMAAGWLERQVSQGRQWLCPACSGKR
jgi:hypothetical protein